VIVYKILGLLVTHHAGLSGGGVKDRTQAHTLILGVTR